jgi:hypothetical protein
MGRHDGGHLVYVEDREVVLPRYSVEFDKSDDMFQHSERKTPLPADDFPTPPAPNPEVDEALQRAEPDEEIRRRRSSRTPKPVSNFAPMLAFQCKTGWDDTKSGTLKDLAMRSFACLARYTVKCGIRVPQNYKEAMASP